MLELNPKQFEDMSRSIFRDNLVEFLSTHVSGFALLPAQSQNSRIDGILDHAHNAGLCGQRAIAAYALASELFGHERLATDPAMARILADRDASQSDRASLMALWSMAAYRHREQEASP